MKFKKVRTKKDIQNDCRIEDIFREFGFAGENRWGWWACCEDDYIFTYSDCATLNERTLSDICYQINNHLKLRT